VCYADGTFDLSFNLQMDTYGLYAALDWVAVSATAVRPGGPDSGIDHYDVVLKDTSPTILYGPPEYFFVQTLLSSDPSSGGLDALKPDVWHHLLLSFDLTGSLSIGNPVADSSCRMWYSIDDKDYRGAENLGPNRDAPASDGTGGDGLGPNTILTFNIYKNSGSAFTGEAYGVPVPPPSGSYTPSPVPTSGREFGIPGTSTYVKDILHVEFAEFQMWTDVTLDTDVEANRRAFIDYERDDNGNPIKDKDGNFTLKPVSPVGQPPSTDNPVGVPSPAEELLKKKPEILLHGSSKWIDGENTGATGMDYSTVPPTVKPDGQFKPTGGINKYTPDPSLPESPSSGSRKAGPVRLTVNARL
jgi:hypothetical protein